MNQQLPHVSLGRRWPPDSWKAVGHQQIENVRSIARIRLLFSYNCGPNARGIVGTFDVEWVHFAWNAWILGAVLLLLTHYRGNSWLWVTAILAGWHGVEHAYMLATYLSTGVAGTAGLLASGGAIAGGLPIGRPDLHFIYNAVETTPLLLAFLQQAPWNSHRLVLA